jgi:hypothetical protein
MTKLIVAAVLATLAAAPAFAGVDGREHHQQTRILHGVGNGSVTPGELNRLENREQAIRREEKFMRKFDGGKLTGFDRHVLNQQLNGASKAIWHAKH